MQPRDLKATIKSQYNSLRCRERTSQYNSHSQVNLQQGIPGPQVSLGCPSMLEWGGNCSQLHFMHIWWQDANTTVDWAKSGPPWTKPSPKAGRKSTCLSHLERPSSWKASELQDRLGFFFPFFTQKTTDVLTLWCTLINWKLNSCYTIQLDVNVMERLPPSKWNLLRDPNGSSGRRPIWRAVMITLCILDVSSLSQGVNGCFPTGTLLWQKECSTS